MSGPRLALFVVVLVVILALASTCWSSYHGTPRKPVTQGLTRGHSGGYTAPMNTTPTTTQVDAIRAAHIAAHGGTEGSKAVRVGTPPHGHATWMPNAKMVRHWETRHAEVETEVRRCSVCGRRMNPKNDRAWAAGMCVAHNREREAMEQIVAVHRSFGSTIEPQPDDDDQEVDE